MKDISLLCGVLTNKDVFSHMKKSISIVFFCLVYLFLTGCKEKEIPEKSEVPEEVLTFVETVMEAGKIGSSEDIKYKHFENEILIQYDLASNDKIIDYKIEHAEMINENLTALTMQIKSEQTYGEYEQVYNFVARIDGELYYVTNVREIPPELKENLDESKYRYENSLGIPEAIEGASDGTLYFEN